MSDDITNTTPEFALPETFQDNAAFEGIDSMDKLAQGYADTHQAHADLVAGQPVIPENAEGYEITVPEGQEADEKLMPAFKSWMHEAGVPNDKAQVVSDNFNAFVGELSKAAEVEAGIKEQAQVDGLKKEWGSEFDGKTKIANDGLQRFYQAAGITEEAQNEFASKFGNDPTAIKMFHAVTGNLLAVKAQAGQKVAHLCSTLMTQWIKKG